MIHDTLNLVTGTDNYTPRECMGLAMSRAFELGYEIAQSGGANIKTDEICGKVGVSGHRIHHRRSLRQSFYAGVNQYNSDKKR